VTSVAAISSLTARGFSIKDRTSCGSRPAGYGLPAAAPKNNRAGEEVMDKIPITRAGFARLKRELEVVKTVSIPQNIKDIEIARGHGDLSENAEYSAAKERQSFLHGKMQELENNLAMSNVIDLKNLTCEKVVFGSTVAIEEIGTGKAITYQLVGPLESDLERERISVTSPIGRALIGKCVGDEVSVKTPGGLREFEIIGITVQEED
jgi:transcription elongation factor GreA